MKTLMLLLAALVCSGASADNSVVQEKFRAVSKLNLSSLQGNTRIVRAAGSEVTVHIQKRSFSDRCSLVVRQAGASLDVEVSKSWLFSNGVHCVTDMVIEVPETTSLAISQATGTLVVENVNNPLAIKSPSALIQLNEVTSREVTVNAVSGNVVMTYLQSAPGRIEIHTTSGSATYTSNSATRISFDSISGRMMAKEKPLSESATSEIRFSSISGSFAWR